MIEENFYASPQQISDVFTRGIEASPGARLLSMEEAPRDGTMIVVKREDRVFGGIKHVPMSFKYGAWKPNRIEGVFFPGNPTLLGFFTMESLGLPA